MCEFFVDKRRVTAELAIFPMLHSTALVMSILIQVLEFAFIAPLLSVFLGPSSLEERSQVNLLALKDPMTGRTVTRVEFVNFVNVNIFNVADVNNFTLSISPERSNVMKDRTLGTPLISITWRDLIFLFLVFLFTVAEYTALTKT